MKTIEVDLGAGRPAEVAVVGPDDGDAVIYFHSPATSADELVGAAPDATRLRLRILSLKRPSLSCDGPEGFVNLVADQVATVVEALELTRPALLAWSGGAPYALAAACRLGPKIASTHLVSPVPGPLTGPDAVPDQSPRIRDVAHTTASSPWATGPAILRDYQAVASPWTFDTSTITHTVTIWAPTEDKIVPPPLAKHLAGQLRSTTVLEVPGEHDWLIRNWMTVLSRVAGN